METFGVVAGAIATLLSIILFMIRQKSNKKKEMIKKANDAFNKIKGAKNESDKINAWFDIDSINRM